MIDETVWIPTRDGKKLEGLLRKPFDKTQGKPAGHGPFPTVVFVPGLGMTLHEWNNSFDEIVKALVAAGYLTLQFQFSIFYSKKAKISGVSPTMSDTNNRAAHKAEQNPDRKVGEVYFRWKRTGIAA